MYKFVCYNGFKNVTKFRKMHIYIVEDKFLESLSGGKESVMGDFFEKFKVGANKAKDEAVKLGKQVADKAENVAGQTKLRFAINDTEGKIKDFYSEIGKRIYNSYTKGEWVDDEIEEKCKKIDSLNEELAALKEKLGELRESVKCPECGEYNDKENIFCSKCGASMEKEDFAETASDDEENVITIQAVKPESDAE